MKRRNSTKSARNKTAWQRAALKRFPAYGMISIDRFTDTQAAELGDMIDDGLVFRDKKHYFYFGLTDKGRERIGKGVV